MAFSSGGFEPTAFYILKQMIIHAIDRASIRIHSFMHIVFPFTIRTNNIAITVETFDASSIIVKTSDKEGQE
jgi:hypothetical protein